MNNLKLLTIYLFLITVHKNIIIFIFAVTISTGDIDYHRSIGSCILSVLQ